MIIRLPFFLDFVAFIKTLVIFLELKDVLYSVHLYYVTLLGIALL